MDQLYYIISRKHASPVHALFWRAEAAGYTTHHGHAGKFTLEQAMKYCGNMRSDSFAVPVETVDHMVTPIVELAEYLPCLNKEKDKWKAQIAKPNASPKSSEPVSPVMR